MKLVQLLIVASASTVRALPFAMSPNPDSYVEKNKDGSLTPPIRLLGRGESGGYDATAEVTEEGYTVSNVLGNYEYMEYDTQLGGMVSSGLVAGKDDPKNAKSKRTGKMLSKNEHQVKFNVKKNKAGTYDQRHLITHIEVTNGIPSQQSHVARRRTAVLGNKKNLIIPFIFSDHISRTVPSTEALTVLMNNQGPNSTICPTGSVRDVYLASSYGQLILNSTVAPWVALPSNETYYAAGNSGLGTMAHIMIRDALNALQTTGFDFTPFDTDNDGYIDAIGFLHSGYGAEWGGTDAYGTPYANRIWSHKWAVYSLPGGKWTSTSGKSVYNYHISPSVWGTSGSAIGRIGVIAHETGHFFGLPDLYDGSGGSGIGSFCLMASSWGFDGSQLYPPQMSAWSKIQLGWVTPTVITTSGSYSARQGCDFPDVFVIRTNFYSGEYLLIENRQNCKFDAKISGPGLAIFHIDDTASYVNEGYPGQIGWPTNGNHYRVALLQADGNYDLEKGNNRGDSTDLFFSPGVTEISALGTSAGLSCPNTKGYQNGIIKETGITISSISAASSTMTFIVNFGPLPPTPAPTMPPANKFRLTLKTDSYPGETAWTLYQTAPSNLLIASKALGSYAANTLYNENYFLGAGNYRFNLTDTYGDGISPGTYTLTLGSTVLKSGGVFKFLDSTSFTVVGTPQPVSSKPVSAKPVSAKPLTKNPITSKPVTLKPVTAQPITAKPVTKKPIARPSRKPSGTPSKTPFKKPSKEPSKKTSETPSERPRRKPSIKPSNDPSQLPTKMPSQMPTKAPTRKQSKQPSKKPSKTPSEKPSKRLSSKPSKDPSQLPTKMPSQMPTKAPTRKQSKQPSKKPNKTPSEKPSKRPSSKPSKDPSQFPTKMPSQMPTKAPTRKQSKQPSKKPNKTPSEKPSKRPSSKPSKDPSQFPTKKPSRMPTKTPTRKPSKQPSKKPSKTPSEKPSKRPSSKPSKDPSQLPTKKPSRMPTKTPTRKPSKQPSKMTSKAPSEKPSRKPSTTNPVTEKPASAKPVSSKPILAKPVTKMPITNEPVTRKPITAKPVTSKPMTTNPVTKKPTSAKPFSSKPISAKPVTSKPLSTKPVTAMPITNKPVTRKPVTAKPVTSKPISAKPVTSKPLSTKSVTEIPITNKPVTRKPVTAKPVTSKPVNGRQVTSKPVNGRQVTAKPITGKPVTVQPVAKPQAPVIQSTCTASAQACIINSDCCSGICRPNKKCE